MSSSSSVEGRNEGELEGNELRGFGSDRGSGVKYRQVSSCLLEKGWWLGLTI